MKKILFFAILAAAVINSLPASANGTEQDIEPKENSFRYENGIPLQAEKDDRETAFFLENELTGIDVSTFQGTIDWEAVKNAGVDFAVIRCGFGDDLTKYDDAQWKRNADECTRLGIPFGAYLYSYAASAEEAQSEASHALRLLEGYELSLPVYLDLEDDTVAACTNDMIGTIADIFCSTLQQNGYDVGIYANTSWWNSRLTSNVFDNESWHKWVADWRGYCGYQGSYSMWQYTSVGRVDGISGNVDMDIWYGGSLGKKDEDDKTDGIGDVNGDGIADAGDAGMILRYDAGLIELTDAMRANADVNGDGIVDAGDAGVILRRDAGLIR